MRGRVGKALQQATEAGSWLLTLSHTTAENVNCTWDKPKTLQSPLPAARLYRLEAVTTPKLCHPNREQVFSLPGVNAWGAFIIQTNHHEK